MTTFAQRMSISELAGWIRDTERLLDSGLFDRRLLRNLRVARMELRHRMASVPAVKLGQGDYERAFGAANNV